MSAYRLCFQATAGPLPRWAGPPRRAANVVSAGATSRLAVLPGADALEGADHLEGRAIRLRQVDVLAHMARLHRRRAARPLVRQAVGDRLDLLRVEPPGLLRHRL